MVSTLEGTKQQLVPSTSFQRSLRKETGCRDVSHEQFTQSSLRTSCKDLSQKMQTGLNLWEQSQGLGTRDQILKQKWFYTLVYTMGHVLVTFAGTSLLFVPTSKWKCPLLMPLIPCVNIHLMYGLKGNSFVFPSVLMFPKTRSRETSGLKGEQN